MRPHRSLLVLLALAASLGACAAAPDSVEQPTFPQPVPLRVQEPVDGLPFDDRRLGPIFDELRANPEWLDEPLAADPQILAVVPGADEVCLALRGPGGDVHVTVDPSRRPWSVSSVSIERPNEAGRDLTYDPAAEANDVCRFIVSGRGEDWPADAGPIVVQGSVAGAEARAIAEAVHAQPERFGIDRHGIPAVNVGERREPAPEGWTCSWGYVFVGGPRSTVIVGTRHVADGWEVETRIVDRAVLDPEPRRHGHC